MTQELIGPAVFVTEEFVTFSEVLKGKLGPREAGAARFWVDQGSIIEQPPKDPNWISTDLPAGCYDTRVWDPIEEQEDGGTATSMDLGNGSALDAALLAQKQKQKTAPKPRTTVPTPNMYTKAAFVGHSDTLGTLSRRKARSSKYADGASDEDEDGQGAAAAAAAAARAAAARELELLPPSASLAKLPNGWDVYDLVLDGPRDTKVAGGRMYVSPNGMVCRSFETAKAMSRAETFQCRWKSDIKNAINWIKTQGTSSKAAIKSNLDVLNPRHLVALERRKTALRPKGKGKKKNKKRKEREHEGKKERKEGTMVPGGSYSMNYTKAIKKKARPVSPLQILGAGPSAPAEKKKAQVIPLPPPTDPNAKAPVGCSRCRFSKNGCSGCRRRAERAGYDITDLPPLKLTRKPVDVERLSNPA